MLINVNGIYAYIRLFSSICANFLSGCFNGRISVKKFIKKDTRFTVCLFPVNKTQSTSCDDKAKRFTDSALLSACFLVS